MNSPTPDYQPEQQADKLKVPPPDSDQITISQALFEKICTTAGTDNGIPFDEFMRLALYDPELGYYSAGKYKIGKDGDFITAPEIGSVFAYCIADQCQQILLSIPKGSILEAGAGHGRLAVDLLLQLEQRNSLPDKYLILELSHSLRTVQRETIQNDVPHLIDRIEWIDTFPNEFHGIILGNELLDAMPVELFEISKAGPVSLNVKCDRDGFQYTYNRDQTSAQITDRLNPLKLPAGYRSELNFQAEAWIRSAADSLAEGVLLLIDYGFPRAEYYHPQRQQGTLMCHYRHHNHDNPFVLIGLQDITAHVDFTAMAEAAVDSNLDVLGYTSQAAFLMTCGLEQLMKQSNPEDSAKHLTLTTEINKLTHPSEMGELFKVIAFGKHYNESLKGFQLQDQRHRL